MSAVSSGCDSITFLAYGIRFHCRDIFFLEPTALMCLVSSGGEQDSMCTRFRSACALAAVASMTAALWLVDGAVATAQPTINLDPDHGPPGVTVTITASVPTSTGTSETDSSTTATASSQVESTRESSCLYAFWDNDADMGTELTCGPLEEADTVVLGDFEVPQEAEVGEHQVGIGHVAGPHEARIFLEATFTVDPLVTTTTNRETTTTRKTTPTVDPTTVSETTTSSDEIISTDTAGSSTGGPSPATIVIVALLALGLAVVSPLIARGLRQRSPRWIAQHVRFVASTAPPQILGRAPRHRPATSVRLEVRRDEPRRKPPKSGKGDQL